MSKTGSAAKVKLNSFDDLFGTEQPQTGTEQVQEIALSELHEFKGHPFKVLDDEKMQETMESIREHGVLMPGIARPMKDGGYEIIAGHRRRHACELVGLTTMPMFIRDYTDDEAIIIMVDSNIQREDILPSEKAKAYFMKYEAVKHQGKKGKGKLLYGLMLDRMSLSMKNGWLDEENRAYIIYTVDAIMEDLGCAKATCVKIMKELDSEKGIGLIEKKRRGLGKPDIIYVKNFATMSAEQEEKEPENTGKSTEVQNLNFKKSNIDTPRSSEIELQEVQNLNHQKYKKQTSRGSETELAEVQDLATIYTNYNKTDINYTDMSYTNPIYPSGEGNQTDDRMDGADAYIEIIKENIEYDHHMKYDEINDRELYDELFELICEVVCVKRTTIRIAGEEYPYELVKSKFLKLRSSHLEYVMGCMKDTTTKISNIKAYMVTALYNAPSTINHYYQQEVQHDMYGGGWHEKGIV